MTNRKINPQDWTEDFKMENGKCLNECILCKREFVGHTRRAVCKICHKENRPMKAY